MAETLSDPHETIQERHRENLKTVLMLMKWLIETNEEQARKITWLESLVEVQRKLLQEAACKPSADLSEWEA